MKAARISIADGSDLEAARAATRSAIWDLDMADSRGTIHPNNAARRKNRLMKQLAALEAGAGINLRIQIIRTEG